MAAVHSFFQYQWIILVVGIAVLKALAVAQHVCDRNCSTNGDPMTCQFELTLEQYLTLSKACYDCPLTTLDCNRKDCIPADGNRRMVVVANRQMPAPLIAVCENDFVVVDVTNRAGPQATSIHWHGINQMKTPFMDGVPFVTQCPIPSFTSFRYIFRADRGGTYFYHSHVGFQRADGFNGMLIVRQPAANDPNSKLYDFDLSEHAIMLSDWASEPGDILFTKFFQSNISILPQSILVNGRAQLRPFTSSEGNVTFTPRALFQVRKNFRYRFRVGSAANFMCALQLSIDGHQLLVIALDGHPIEPVLVDSIVITPADRFDFVLFADKPIRNYWMKIHGILLCEPLFTAAILTYEGGNNEEPPETLSIQSTFRPGTVVNPINIPALGNKLIDIYELNATVPDDVTLKRRPDKRFYLAIDMVTNRDPNFFDPVYYPWESFPVDYQHPIATINNISFAYPPSPLMSQYKDVPEDLFCNETSLAGKNCGINFCRCLHRLRVPLGSVVEVVLIDVGNYSKRNFSHSFHLHGHYFRVLAQKEMITGNTVKNIKKLDALGLIPRKFKKAPRKDTVVTPHGGYAIIRFHAINPGFWAFHCHVEYHTEDGMVLVFQVGEVEDMPKPPPNFPKCGNFQLPFPEKDKIKK